MKRIVVKVGTHSLCGEDGSPSKEKISKIGYQIAQLMKKNIEVVLVSSGSIGAGSGILLDGAKPKTLALKQACAAAGQPILMSLYRSFFDFYHIQVAQILMSPDVINQRENFLNARNTIFTLISKQVLPIVNENDSVSVEEIQFGDNDNLAINVSALIEAEACFFLSDIDGFYKNFGTENQEIIHEVYDINDEIKNHIKKKKSGFSTGGMESKLIAAKKAIELGIKLVILPGNSDDALLNYILNNDKIGTAFYSQTKLKSRKQWLYLHFKREGKIFIDEGAKDALLKNKSLLPVGLEEIQGKFLRGAIVDVYYKNNLIAKGMSNYASEDLKKIKKQKSENIEKVLGFSYGSEAIHKNNLILTIV